MAQTVKNLSAMQEIWVWSLDRGDPPEKGMAIHSSILAEEPNGLQFMESQRLRHNWAQQQQQIIQNLTWPQA